MDFPFFSVIVIIFSLVFLTKIFGLPGFCMAVGAILLMFCLGFAPEYGLIAIGIGLFGFFWMCYRVTRSPRGRQEMKEYTEAQKKYEEEYGIIDFTEKDK